MSNTTRRGPGRPRNPGGTLYRNVTLNAEDVEALNELQKKLAARLGFEPTLSQTLRWLISNAEKVLKTEGAG